jgi:diguanylate cyclase (GGDEF)-like protein
MRLLLVEDDEVQAHTIKQALTAQGYVVDWAADGEEGWDFIEAFTYDLMLLDVSLPKLDGIGLCRRARDRGHNAPILLLTARGSSTDKVTGLDSGADDYVVKPCTVPELFARIRALLRRRNASGAPLLTWGDLSLDPSSHELNYGQQLLSLSPKEYHLLELFLRNPRRVLTHSAILEHLWSFEDPPSEGTVRAHIKRLRRKLKEAGITEMIETIYGVGYRLKAEPTLDIPSNPPDRPSANLTAVWEQFKPQIWARLTPLNQAADALASGTLTVALAQEAAAAAHKLAGSLGIFGLKSGYTLAQGIEQQLLEALENHQDGFVVAALSAIDDIKHLCDIVKNPEIAQPKTQPAPTATSAITHPSIARVLIVDDDVALTQQLQQAALSWNFQVEVVWSIAAAKETIARQLPDLILLDVAFPHAPQGGLLLLEELKAQYPHLPIVMFSARDRLSDRAAICQTAIGRAVSTHDSTETTRPLPILDRFPQGGDAFLSKLISPSEVMATIAEMLKPVLPTTNKVLVVDDDPVILDTLERLLSSWGLTPILLSDPRQFWETLEAHGPDLLILDYKMPYYNGLQLCQIARNDPMWQGLPILFMTSETHQSVVQQIYQSGADDYVAKPFSEAELVTRIFNRLERVQLLRSLAETDVLTGLTNRRRASQEISRYLRLCQRHHQLFSLVMLDVNNFKPINDRYGHGVGDRVLRQLGIIFQQQFRQEDVVARWGGDEFVIGLYAMQKSDAAQRIQELLYRTSTMNFLVVGQVQLQLSLSAGIATYPEDGSDLPSLYAFADAALYRAKAAHA